MNQKATNSDVLKSYIMARLLDNELIKHKEFTSELIATCIRMAEREFLKVDFH
jgi:hypothetical protein